MHYGFIRPVDPSVANQEDIFLHGSQLAAGSERPTIGSLVT